jgi:hypothetical protein
MRGGGGSARGALGNDEGSYLGGHTRFVGTTALAETGVATLKQGVMEESQNMSGWLINV